jgi:hypothetical protein
MVPSLIQHLFGFIEMSLSGVFSLVDLYGQFLGRGGIKKGGLRTKAYNELFLGTKLM